MHRLAPKTPGNWRQVYESTIRIRLSDAESRVDGLCAADLVTGEHRYVFDHEGCLEGFPGIQAGTERHESRTRLALVYNALPFFEDHPSNAVVLAVGRGDGCAA
jgi:hypothetical protein